MGLARLTDSRVSFGLIRQYLTKKQSMAHLTQHDRTRIATQLNNRPHKRLGYRTPEECHARRSLLHFKLDIRQPRPASEACCAPAPSVSAPGWDQSVLGETTYRRIAGSLV